MPLMAMQNVDLNCAGEPETLEPHHRDAIKENEILIWIYNMIDEVARVDFEFFLKDGCILCKLMNRIKPGCIPEETITWEGARSKQTNIKNFLHEAEAYGVPKAKLFHVEDLLHLRHIPRVARCIWALAKQVAEDPNMGADCPRLGDEPSFMQEQKKKVDVPGHRDTKDVLAQLTAEKKKEEKKSTKHSLYN
ncbi:myophilin-like [Eriocheir sinensis]|uniref:myophilin-like n=1 Tax=Eriocheir sinensis TaxID=95602 RepID=UPI0021C7A1B7|nr:myophilin-like [Eriocheir sinensis]